MKGALLFVFRDLDGNILYKPPLHRTGLMWNLRWDEGHDFESDVTASARSKTLDYVGDLNLISTHFHFRGVPILAMCGCEVKNHLDREHTKLEMVAITRQNWPRVQETVRKTKAKDIAKGTTEVDRYHWIIPVACTLRYHVNAVPGTVNDLKDLATAHEAERSCDCKKCESCLFYAME
jgi:hypothetical protein